MDLSEHVLSAGRAVLDWVQREWEPLSQAELEQRLDQAVEEILEADLVAKVKAQPPAAIYLQLVQSPAAAEPQVVSAEAAPCPAEEEVQGGQEVADTADSNAVKVNSTTKSSQI